MPDPMTVLPRTPQLIGIAADHGGYELKEYLVEMLRDAGYEVLDFGDGQRVQKAMQAVASQASLKTQQEGSCGTIMSEKKGLHP